MLSDIELAKLGVIVDRLEKIVDVQREERILLRDEVVTIRCKVTEIEGRLGRVEKLIRNGHSKDRQFEEASGSNTWIGANPKLVNIIMLLIGALLVLVGVKAGELLLGGL